MHGRLDLAVTFDYDLAPQPPPAAVERTRFAEDPVFAALPRTHPLAGEESIELGSLADSPWIAAPLAGLPLGALRDVAHRAGFHPKLEFAGDDFRTVLALVAHGLGIALLPRLALDAVPDTVAIRPLTDAPMARYLYVSRQRTRTTRPAVAALEEAIRQGTA